MSLDGREFSPDIASAITKGLYRDPFSILGAHSHEDGVIVRVFQPAAMEVAIVLDEDGSEHSMERVHPDGLYEVSIPGKRPDMLYKLKLDHGEVLHEDIYAFRDVLSQFDEYLLAEGTHEKIYDKLGAHKVKVSGSSGVYFAVWAPNAAIVSVIGDFNEWDPRRAVMRHHHGSGIWNIFVPGLTAGALYKYQVMDNEGHHSVAKSDPLAFSAELRPQTASIVWDLDNYDWGDQDWLSKRMEFDATKRPLNIYEVHLGSWRRKGEDEWLSYASLAEWLIPYVKEMGYTHLELLPVAEHPYDGSWGYQVTGYFAATSRHGTPDDFMAFVDACHQNNIGVILDWVPAHFPRDEHGLAKFDGTHIYEHADPRQGSHPDWGTLIFNYGRAEVRQFLISNALFWLEKYHIDGLRVDAVASMLYLDFSREAGQWVPNRYGGRENLEAIEFIKQFNQRVHINYPDVLTIAEESTSWPGVTRPVDDGGLGFDLKWNMGWMHDTLQYMSNDPIYRAFHHGTLTFSLLYAFSERFLLPFSHDEVVHLKKSMLEKMPGDRWQQFANLRALYAYQIAHPGKKMLFMGDEFGQIREWSEARSLDWHLVEYEGQHKALQTFVREANHLYKGEAALFENDNSWDGFSWIDLHDAQRSILAFARHAASSDETIMIVCNLTPVVRYGYRLGVHQEGPYSELLNSDEIRFAGSGIGNHGSIISEQIPWHGRPFSIELSLPPLAVVFLKLC